MWSPRRKRLCATLTALLFVNFGLKGVSAIEPEEYEIFSVVIAALYQDLYPDQQLILLDKTIDDPAGKYYRDEQTQRVIKRLRPLVKRQTLNNFRIQNEQAYSVEPRLKIARTYILLSREQADAALNGSHFWVAVSRVAFDSSRSQALLMVINNSGPLQSAGYLVLLAKKDERWEIQRQEGLFVS